MKYRTDDRDYHPYENTHRGSDCLAFVDLGLGQKWKLDDHESVHTDGCNSKYTAIHVGVMGAQEERTQVAYSEQTIRLRYSEGQKNNDKQVCDEQVEHVDVRVGPMFDATEDAECCDVEDKAN